MEDKQDGRGGREGRGEKYSNREKLRWRESDSNEEEERETRGSGLKYPPS